MRPEIRLELCDPSGAGFGRSTARDGRVEVRRHRRPKHVCGVVFVSHPQGNPQVGVGAEVVLDDSRGTLGGQDEVQTKRSAALSNIDDAVNELWNLTHQRSELVHDDDETRRAVRIARLLQLQQVLGALLVEQVFPVAQLGPKAA